MPRVLRNLKIDEISGVTRGAGEACKIVIRKGSDDMSTIISKVSDNEYAEALGVVIAKGACSKSEAFQAMQQRAEQLRQPGETSAAAFAKAFTGLTPRIPGGAALLQAHSAMGLNKAMPKVRQPDVRGGDHARAFDAGVQKIMHEQKVSRSAAIDKAMSDPSLRVAFEADKQRARSANA